MAELKTFIFTDVVRSVALKNEMSGRDDIERDRAFIECVLTPHRERIESDLATHGGRIVSTAGDGHFLVFSDTVEAAIWAVGVQERHLDEPIRTPHGSKVEVRVSLHVGVPQIDPRDEHNFVGKTVDYTARLNDFAQGGQILISRSVASMLDDAQIAGLSIHPHGHRALKGIGRVEVHELVYRETGPMETVYLPAKTDEREWTVLPAGSGGPPRSTDPSGGSLQSTAVHTAHPRRLGNYELGELLGSGGMGDVYRATHTQFGRSRAIKVIKQHFVDAGHRDVVRRFYQEIKATGALEHPNIVVAVDSSSPSDHIHFLVMEYLDGISLSDLVAQHGPLSIPDACEVARQAARGLAYIHRHGMVHRDIKPSNLMLTVTDQGAVAVDDASSTGATFRLCGVVKILDLGLALLVADEQDRLTRFDQRAMGTGMYMSPEQWKTTTVDIRADVYSLGCTLYHLLAGRPPFHDSDLKPEKAHEKSKIPPIFGPTEIPRKLWDVVKKMLAKQPEDRYQSPAEVAAALAPFCAGNDLVSLVQEYQAYEDDATAVIGTEPQSRPTVETLPLASSTKSDQRRLWARPRTWWTAGGVLLVALAATAIAKWVWPDPQVVKTPQHGAAAEWIATLPGLSGVSTRPGFSSIWWYEEAPWLFPEERARLLYKMGEREFEYLETLSLESDVQTFYAALRETPASSEDAAQTGSAPPKWLTSSLYSRCRDVLSNLDPLAAKSKADLRSLADELCEKSESQRTAVEWHLLGVLHAALMEREAAIAALATAQEKYEEDADDDSAPVTQGLLALCLADRAAVASPSEKDALLERALASLRSDASPCFRVFVLGVQSLARLGDASSSRDAIVSPLEVAERLLADSPLPLAEDHPLRAFIHERRAHFCLESWQLDEARKQAGKALPMRDRFGKISVLDVVEAGAKQQVEGYHFAQQAYFRDLQLQALAEHYRGDSRQIPILRQENASIPTPTPAAFRTLQILLDYVQQQSNYDLTDEQKAIWLSLRPNFRGRQADCQMFLMGKFADAAKAMQKAIGFAGELGWPNDPSKHHILAFMHYKRAIALSLSGESVAAQAVRKKARTEGSSVRPELQDRFRVFASVADVLDKNERERAADLLLILEEEVPDLGTRRRDDRQLLLFMCQYVIRLEESASERGREYSFLDAGTLAQLKQQLIDPTREGREISALYRDFIGGSVQTYLDASQDWEDVGSSGEPDN